MSEIVELVWSGGAILSEGPVWDDVNRRLVWVDILGTAIHLLDPASGRHRTIALDQKVGAAVPRTQGGFVLALEHGFYTLNTDTEVLNKLVDPESDQPGNRFNDGKCDSAGRFWAGTMDMMEQDPAGSLYCLKTDGTVHKVREGIYVSNGLGWSPDNHTMYHIDSPTKRVLAFQYDLDSGQLTNGRIAITVLEGEGFPDGMTVDAEGMLWMAHWDGWQVSRWNPATGEKIASIPVPAAKVSSVSFGGNNYDELYIATARIGLNEEQLMRQPHAAFSG